MTFRKTVKTLVCCITLTLCLAVNSQATEAPIGAYPNGAEGFNAGALPPPGTYFLNYFNFYTASSLKDKDGKDFLPTFELNALANVFRVLHMTKLNLMGGNVGMQVLVPVVNLEVKVPGRSQVRNGLGDIVIDPFIWAFHTKNFHYAAALDIYMPTGRYDKSGLANIGRNYWTFEPVVGMSYISDSGYELSTKIMYDFNTENDATNYQTGQEFHFDYTLAKKFGPLTAGVGGYFYKQVTDDEKDGKKFHSDGNKGQVIAAGPQIKYDYKNMSFILKYQREMLAENKPEGDKFWFNLVYAF
jgi:hypothetical protein